MDVGVGTSVPLGHVDRKVKQVPVSLQCHVVPRAGASPRYRATLPLLSCASSSSGSDSVAGD